MAERPRSNLSRIAAILAAFDSRNTPRPSQKVLTEAGIGRATGFALVRAMVAENWLERVDHGLLRLGPRAADLMYSPLEPSIALGASSGRLLSVGARPSHGASEGTWKEDWRSDLVEIVDTSGFARSGRAKIGFSNASLSNPWRLALLSSMRYAQRLNSDRIASLDVLTADDNPESQLVQIQQLVSEGIDLLIVSCTDVSSAAVNDYLLTLAEDGLPIVAVDRRPSDASSLVSFVTASDDRIGRVSAQWMTERLDYEGRVWMLSGVEGASPAVRRQAAALRTFAAHPGIVVEAVAYTDWTEAGGYAAIDRLITQSRMPPDGVWCDSGLQGVGSLTRFVEAGGPLPIHSGGDLNQMYKAALHQKLPFVAVDYPAAMGAKAVETGLDILAGKSVRRRVEVAAPVVLPRGLETRSVRADIWAETHVRWELPDDAILSQGPSLRPRQDAPKDSHDR